MKTIFLFSLLAVLLLGCTQPAVPDTGEPATPPTDQPPDTPADEPLPDETSMPEPELGTDEQAITEGDLPEENDSLEQELDDLAAELE